MNGIGLKRAKQEVKMVPLLVVGLSPIRPIQL